MYSLKELYKIGNGPSSSHTMGPKKATLEVLQNYPYATYIKVVLYGSLALTGKGHLTDEIISKTLNTIPHDIIFDFSTPTNHPNTMQFIVYQNDKIVCDVFYESIGGGTVVLQGQKKEDTVIYPHHNLEEIKHFCCNNHLSFDEYIDLFEKDIDLYLDNILCVMENSVLNGIAKEGYLPGTLKTQRKAKNLFHKAQQETNPSLKEKAYLIAYAFAAAEENASGGEIVTAPTCGASGILPALVYYYHHNLNYQKEEIIKALKVAGLFGNVVKKNASISGAECGCQAEIGTACSMGAIFVSSLLNGTLKEIETSAEIALEHHLGLTCDPILGYVQIPCIERNAVATLRSIDSSHLALLLRDFNSKISFDVVVATMKETGCDLHTHYRETSLGGLAKKYKI